MILKKSIIDSGAIGQIRPRLLTTFKHRVTIPIQEKLNDLAMKVNIAGIQTILNFKFTDVISPRVEKSIYNTNSKLKLTSIKYTMNSPVI